MEGARTFPSPACALVLHDFRGAPSRIAQDATAFPLRRDHYNCEIIGAWDPAEDGTRIRSWVQELSNRLSNPSTPGGYVSLLAPNDTELVHQFFGDSFHRLARIKSQVDPTNTFSPGIGQLRA